MGVVPNVGHDEWPRQGSFLGKRAEVTFNYDTRRTVYGTYVRDDAEAPWVELIRLDDGRHILTTECQHMPVPEPEPETEPVCPGFAWLGQSFACCDECGHPYWEHTHDRQIAKGAGPFDDKWEFVLISEESKAAAKAKWGGK